MRSRNTPVLLVLLILCGLVASVRGAEPQQLWFYYTANLLVDGNIDALEPIWRRAAAAGYDHVLLHDAKFARLGQMPPRYLENCRRVQRLADDLKLTIVPAIFPVGYSNDLLAQDPNLAEGLPVKNSLFVVRGGVASPQPDPPVRLDQPTWKDDAVSIVGHTATVAAHRENARFVYNLKLPPYRCYGVSVKIRTVNHTGEPRISALADGRALTYSSLNVKPTQDWTEHHIVFNTLGHTDIRLYFGVWGEATGELQWKDWRIEEVALLNLLRRDGAPLVVADDRTGRAYVEGVDFQPIGDPRLGVIPFSGSYELWHAPPRLRTALPDGTRLRVSWYYPPIIYQDQVTICPSEQKTGALLAEQFQRVNALWNAPGYMMSYDEIRALNQDASCAAANRMPGQILAQSVRDAAALLEGKQAYVWSDMFDPFHNAVDNYYLVNGDLNGSWLGLEKRVTIVNWNFAQRDKSLDFFAQRGHRQLVAAYYDAPLARTRQWVKSAGAVAGIQGFMYTTWEHNYADLEAFARLVRVP